MSAEREQALRDALAALDTERDRYAADLAALGALLRAATERATAGNTTGAVEALAEAADLEHDLMLCTEITERLVNALGLAEPFALAEDARASPGALAKLS
ncbi:MAG: hypothetical protein QM756_24090 [Polyangiaceae bacterium]